MNYLTKIFTLVLMIFAQNAVAENWVIYAKNDVGDHYIETEAIRERDGFVYFWKMNDLLEPTSVLEPTSEGSLSVKIYDKLDCGLKRFQRLSYVFYKESMGRGTPDYQDSLDKEWKYIIPGSLDAIASIYACSFID